MTNEIDVNEMNRGVIAEFRENAGKVGGPFEGATMLLLHTVGAKSGAERINPLVFQALDDGWAVFASKGGAPTHPAWYHNVVANSDLSIEVGTETINVKARTAEGDEHDRIWNGQKAIAPQFAEYEKTAGGRKIPVVILERR
jgi:deazaflavin-dependent oxidoreductase (nitroreductase family)